jgi:drug/metabolite transporter (DMT)-like permease
MPLNAIPPALLSLPILSGVAFAVIGIAYRQGQRRGLTALHIVLHMALWGAVFFALGTSAESWAEAPTLILTLGLVCGITQWLTAILIGCALRLGPLSPMWCALNLTFLPVTIHSAVFFDEPVLPVKIAGLGLAIVTVILASLRTQDPKGEPSHLVSAPLYGLLLVALLLFNSVMHVSIKHLGTVAISEGETLMTAFGPVFFTCLYIALFIPIAVQHALRRDRRALSRAGWTWGSVAGIGSIGGVGFLALSASLPGAVVFTLSAVFSILGAGIASVTLFGERASAVWFAMMGTAVVSVVLVSL